MFSIFAHPAAHAVAYFHYIKKATWDPKYNSEVDRMTLRQYAASKHIENNPLVRLLTKTPGKDTNRVLTKDDLEAAKKIIESKCLVGLYRDLEGSLARFDRYFGWSFIADANNSTNHEDDKEREMKLTTVKKCRSDYMQTKGDYWMTRHQKKLEADSLEMKLIEKANELDLELYSHIELVFEAQGEKIFNVV